MRPPLAASAVELAIGKETDISKGEEKLQVELFEMDYDGIELTDSL